MEALWMQIAQELDVPWRSAEAMHWYLGEDDMARRAGLVPWSKRVNLVHTFQRPLAQRTGSQQPTSQQTSAQGLQDFIPANNQQAN
jgi:hypothetical protein